MSSDEVKNTARCTTKGAHISEGQCPPVVYASSLQAYCKQH